MRRLCFFGIGIVVMVSLLVACGGNGFTQTVDTDSYRVQLGLDGVDFEQHTATITVQDKSGQAAAVDQVVVVPIMEAMGMVSPEQTAQPLGDGRYQAQGQFFSMLGDWEFDVRVSAGGKQEVARFKVPVQ
jgi:major membrane immunogen (membrane-anchored lipoprotein)